MFAWEIIRGNKRAQDKKKKAGIGETRMTLQNDNYSANQAGRGLRKKNNAKGYGAAKSRKKKALGHVC